MEVSVSILNSIDRLLDVNKLNNTSCDYIHIDVMDGKFVSDTQFSITEIQNVILNSLKKVDIHLMVSNPLEYVNELCNYDIDYITFHGEIDMDIYSVINKIKRCGKKVGIAINPNTDISKIIKYLDLVDMVLVMSVEPGKGGQSFIDSTLTKIVNLRKIINDKNLNVKIEVDGGINANNIISIKNGGADISVVGSYVINSDDFEKSIIELK